MIEIINLCKSFDENPVLDNLNLTIKTGETMVVIGQSGCGKSVLLKLIIGILKPDAGEVLINDVDITRLKESELNELRMKFGMVFQGSALFDSLTVAENVGFCLYEHTNLNRGVIQERVRECLAMVGLKDCEDLRPAQLSGGMKKRVALARAICMHPEIILYDEPTTGLDPIIADAINNLIKELHDRLKITAVCVTHDMKSAYRIADRIAMLYRGKIVEVGTSEEIENTQNQIVRQFIRGAAQGPIPTDFV